MTRRFEYNLPIRRYLPLFYGLYVPIVLLYIALIVQSVKIQENPGNPAGMLIVLLAFVLFFLLYTLLYIPILRVTVPALSLDGKQFGFRGSIGRWFGMNLLGCFLTAITLGIYGAWYITRITRYITEETSYDGKPFIFKGRGGTLFLILLLTLGVPIAVIIGVMVASAVAMGAAGSRSAVGTLLVLVIVPVYLIALGAYVYYAYRWIYDNLRFEGYAVRWNARFWPLFGMFLGQTLLTVITLFIYYPAAYLRMYRYIARHVIVKEGEGPEAPVHATLEFDGPMGGGFLLLWGQGLLSLITAGIYYPWAMARVGRWLASHTSVETR
jgi:uncharacterized membrane protein YjgN (DUF898 family)